MMSQNPKAIRSPSYPIMSLESAVDGIRKIERQYRSSPIDRTVAAKLLGYSSLSGPANKALAALASYGLLERTGKGEARVTERARDILHAESDEARKASLREAALEPPLFRELRDRFEGIPVPPEDGVVTYLNRQGFNPRAVPRAAKAFLETMSYLEELRGSESHGSETQTNGESLSSQDKTSKVTGGAVVGDLIQWEANGVLCLPEPRKVRVVSDDGQWVFVEKSETGIPMDQVIVEKKADQGIGGASTGRQPPTLPLEDTLSAEMTREITHLDEGTVTLTMPETLSKESFAELETWMNFILSKARRRAGVQADNNKT